MRFSPSLTGLLAIVEADPALRARLLSDVPFGTKSMVLTQTLQVWFFQAGAKAQDLRRRLSATLKRCSPLLKQRAPTKTRLSGLPGPFRLRLVSCGSRFGVGTAAASAPQTLVPETTLAGFTLLPQSTLLPLIELVPHTVDCPCALAPERTVLPHTAALAQVFDSPR